MNWFQEFENFIQSPSCPLFVQLGYTRVLNKHYNGTKYVDPVSRDRCSTEITDSEDEAAIILAGMGGKKPKDIEDSVLANIDKGFEFEWSTPPKVSHF